MISFNPNHCRRLGTSARTERKILLSLSDRPEPPAGDSLRALVCGLGPVSPSPQPSNLFLINYPEEELSLSHRAVLDV